MSGSIPMGTYISRAIAVLIIISAWYATAYYWGANSLARTLPFWGPPLVPIVALSYGLLSYSLIKPFREGIAALGIRGLSLIEGIRVYAGYEVLLANSQGRLPADFAIPNGVMTIIVGFIFLYIAGSWRELSVSTSRLKSLLWFNVFSFIQAMFIILSVAFIILQGRGAEFRHFPDLPLNLLPSFFVPLELFIGIAMIHLIVTKLRPLSSK